MQKVRVGKIDSAEAVKLLNRADIQKLMLEHAERIAARAGAGFEADVQAGKRRARGIVKSTTEEAMRAQATSNALLKAVGT